MTMSLKKRNALTLAGILLVVAGLYLYFSRPWERLDAPSSTPTIEQLQENARAMGMDADTIAAILPPAPSEPLSIITMGGAQHDFNVEVVATSESTAQGLMFRKTMPADYGMLFVFRRAGALSFWMKNTLIPLDIIFIDAQGRIINVGYGEPLSLKHVPAAEPAHFVLELNAGTAERLGLGKGAVVRHPIIDAVVAAGGSAEPDDNVDTDIEPE